MYKYIAIFIVKLKSIKIYKLNFGVMIVSGILPVIGILFYLLSFDEYNFLNGYSRPQLITYYILSYILNILFSPDIAWSISDDIQTGKLNYIIITPINYIFLKLSEEVNKHIITYPILIITISLAYLGFFPDWLSKPYSILSLLLCFVSITLGSIYLTLVGVIMGLLSVWFNKINGIFYMQSALIQILSGAVIPLNWFDNWFGKILQWNPFSFIVFYPLSIYMGDYGDVLLRLIIFIFWILLLFLITKIVWRMAMKKYQAYGG